MLLPYLQKPRLEAAVSDMISSKYSGVSHEDVEDKSSVLPQGI